MISDKYETKEQGLKKIDEEEEEQDMASLT